MEDPDVEEHEQRSPLAMIGALFLTLLLILWIVPTYTIPSNPEPSTTLSLTEALVGLRLPSPEAPAVINKRSDYHAQVDGTNPTVKTVADRIVSAGCKSSPICQAKALFYFVRDEFHYVRDPSAYEYVKTPVGALQSTAGDCDDASVLLASMLESIGVKTKFVFVPGHVYVKAYLPDAVNRHTDAEGWVPLDATCADCGFGEVAA